MFTSARDLSRSVSLHVVTYDENECEGCGTCNFVKGWSHGDLVCERIGIILVTRLPFQRLRCEHQKKHFLNNNKKINSWFYFFYPRKNKVDFFSSKVLLILSGGGCLCFVGAV